MLRHAATSQHGFYNDATISTFLASINKSRLTVTCRSHFLIGKCSRTKRIDRLSSAMPIVAAKGKAMRGSRQLALMFCLASMPLASRQASAADGYPTSAVAEYVFVCMKTNGETRDALERCSCAIDVITSILPYEHFVTAETFRRMGLLTGEKGEIFRGSAPAKAAVTEMSRAQIEAEVRCF